MTSPVDPGKASNAFLQGFAGCLGAGAALIVISLLLLGGCALLVHVHG